MIKQVNSYNYFVSKKGDVYNASGLKLKPRINKQGYLKVSLSKNGKQKGFFIHRLVAIAFIDNPDQKKTVNHINGIKNDNRVENLEWATQQENNMHAWETGLQNANHLRKRVGKNHFKSKPVVQINNNNEIVAYWESASFCETVTNFFKQSHINNCANGKEKQHKGFVWRYVDNDFILMQYR